jgi:hypothetical protein
MSAVPDVQAKGWENACGLTLLLALWLVLTVATAGGAADLPPSGAVDGAQGHALMKELGERLLVLDVRTHEEFATGHIPGALFIPVQELEKRLEEIPGDTPVLILCRTGVRAAKAYEMLARARPEMLRSGLWHLKAAPVYRQDGSFVFP